jgi:hypothetical protein
MNIKSLCERRNLNLSAARISSRLGLVLWLFGIG